MKASEVTESGFYWWKDTESEGYCESEWPSPDGWQVVYAQASEIITFYKTGSEVPFWDDQIPGEIHGPIDRASVGEGNER